ncbi:hypothetical protein GCM10009750_25350 [Agromyces salentinus]|uniref:Phosphoribosyltransferase domain-containing protein n=1 Tax=Agromyces salentinus TaxID=269421 RepID=A0ABP4Z2Z9_9MICO
MTAAGVPPALQPVDDLATRTLTPLLVTPVRLPLITCAVCTEPTGGSEYCAACRAARNSWPTSLADWVVPLTYASDTATPQIRNALRQYKDGWDEPTRGAAFSPLTYLLWQFLTRHSHCLEAAAGGSIDGYVIVPSGRATPRQGGHPIEGFAPYFPWPRMNIQRVTDAPSRSIAPLSLYVPDDVSGKRILIFDDTWTTGASAQGVSAALKREGAASTVILVLGRWVNSGWTPTQAFFSQRPPRTWSPATCPVTGGICPGA